MVEEQTDIHANDEPVLPVTTRRYTLHKAERLSHHSLVEHLFAVGNSVYAYPLRMFWTLLEPEQVQQMFHGHIPPQMDHLQMLITVPKKRFHHAVDRVRLRRRIREAYRLQRHNLKDKLLADDNNRYLLLAFIYVGAEERTYASIEKKMLKLLDKAIEVLEPANDAASAETVTNNETA